MTLRRPARPAPALRGTGHSRVRIALALQLVTLAIPTTSVEGQRIVPVHQEPRHRLIHEDATVRVLDVQILPGDTTLFHQHASPVAYVTLSPSTTDQRTLGGAWGGVVPREPPPGSVGDVRVAPYAEGTLTHQVTNVGSTLFRLLAIATRGPGSAEAPSGPMPGEPIGESRWFRQSRTTLPANGESAVFRADRPTVVVLIDPGRVTLVQHTAGWRGTLDRVGEIEVVDAGAEYRLLNPGPAPVRVVFVEVR